MDISIAYEQHQKIQNIHAEIAEVQKEIGQVDFAYKVAFVGTFILYFCFVWAMYISDLWGFTTWLTENISEFAALLIYGVLAIALPLTMALIKELAYRHFSKYPNDKALMILVVFILAAAGVIYESIVSSSQQQHMAFGSAENSASFKVITETTTATTNPDSLAVLIAEAQKQLARCKEKLKAGTEPHCKGDAAKLQGYLDAEKRAMDSAERAGVAAIQAKTDAIQDLKEENHKPVFKSIRDSFGVSINTGIMVVTIFVSTIFEISHLLLILLLAQKQRLLTGLKSSLINAESDYMRSTGKTFKAEDFADNSVLNMDDIREHSPAPMGFGQPATAQFKYQQVQRQPIGFVRTDAFPRENTPAPATAQPVTAKVNNPKLGKAEIQLQMPGLVEPETSTYNRELSGHGIHSPEDDALNKPADKADIQRIIDKGLSTAKPPAPTTPETTSKPQAGGLAEAPEKTTSKPQAGGGEGLYGRWITAVKSGECRPSVDGTWKWIQKRTTAKESGKSSFHRSHISNMQKGFFSRAIHDGLMNINPKYKRGGKKYIWIG